MAEEYVRQDLGEEIQAIGGHYVIIDEVRLPFEGKQILYQKCYALIDGSCCGVGGCPFVHVKGFLLDWKRKKDFLGQDVSLVEPIREEGLKRTLQKLLQEKEVYHQIRFD